MQESLHADGWYGYENFVRQQNRLSRLDLTSSPRTCRLVPAVRDNTGASPGNVIKIANVSLAFRRASA
jgi:hypothetical protein